MAPPPPPPFSPTPTPPLLAEGLPVLRHNGAGDLGRLPWSCRLQVSLTETKAPLPKPNLLNLNSLYKLSLYSL